MIENARTTSIDSLPERAHRRDRRPPIQTIGREVRFEPWRHLMAGIGDGRDAKPTRRAGKRRLRCDRHDRQCEQSKFSAPTSFDLDRDSFPVGIPRARPAFTRPGGLVRFRESTGAANGAIGMLKGRAGPQESGFFSARHAGRYTASSHPEDPGAKPNYSFEKRQREIAKKKAQDEKDARKREAREAARAAANPDEPAPSGNASDPSASK